jgi:hypothetical protein
LHGYGTKSKYGLKILKASVGIGESAEFKVDMKNSHTEAITIDSVEFGKGEGVA